MARKKQNKTSGTAPSTTKSKNIKNNPPPSVKIAYVDYQLVPMSGEQADKESIAGDCQHDEETIRYNESLSNIEIVNTIVHEILHGIFYRFNMKMSEKKEEMVTLTTANGLITVFRDNPELFDWIYRTIRNDNSKKSENNDN